MILQCYSEGNAFAQFPLLELKLFRRTKYQSKMTKREIKTLKGTKVFKLILSCEIKFTAWKEQGLIIC